MTTSYTLLAFKQRLLPQDAPPLQAHYVTHGNQVQQEDRAEQDHEVKAGKHSMEQGGHSREQGAACFPRAIMAVRREQWSNPHDKPTEADLNQKGNMAIPSFSNVPLGISVQLQTDNSWLHKHTPEIHIAETHKSIIPTTEDSLTMSGHEDLCSSLSEGLSELTILCDMEFSSYYKTFFEEPLKTLPSIGPPTILAYKRESSENDRLLAMMQILNQQSEKEKCEFCGQPLRPFPLDSSVKKPFHNSLFCCTQYRSVFEFLFNEQKEKERKEKVELISIAPHASHGNEAERQQSKEKAAERLRERRIAKSYSPIVSEPTTFPEFGKPMKTISYQLSNVPLAEENCTALPDASPSTEELDAEQLEDECTSYDFILTSEQMASQFVEKFYRTGQRFLITFPDGTAQIFYPSGNVAVVAIATNRKDSVYIIQGDKDVNADILAVFGSSGKATCYHPNGNVWLSLNPVGGQYFDHTGMRLRRWRWKSTDLSEPYVPFKPVFISLNQQVGIRICSQEQIYISFLSMGKQAKINIWTRHQTKTQVDGLEVYTQMKREIPEEELILFATKIKILSLLNKLEGYVNFPTNEQWDKLKAPPFLVAQAQRLVFLCNTCSVRKEVQSLIRALLLSSHMDLPSIMPLGINNLA
ncbi:glutamate-rich protein 6 [Xenopus tropicalis]|uniref:Glutamate-rich protein 6 n=2 Tax=Xenopus tropicalis TaxID=8364 RepID=A0A8J0T457_XENTR|nr:glutamate-rich protein 6 [Xenopus tropicalis]